jgi:hypothetical protein
MAIPQAKGENMDRELDPASEQAVDDITVMVKALGHLGMKAYTDTRLLLKEAIPNIYHRTILTQASATSMLHGFTNSCLGRGYLPKGFREQAELLLKVSEGNVELLKRTLALPDESNDDGPETKH